MIKIRVPVIFYKGHWMTAFPTYRMENGSWSGHTDAEGHPDGVHPDTQPTDELMSRLSCEIWVPESYIRAEDGQLDHDVIGPELQGSSDSGLFLPEHIRLVEKPKPLGWGGKADG